LCFFIDIASSFKATTKERWEEDMFTASITKAHASHQSTKLRQLISLLIVLVCALTHYSAKAHAQIIGELEVNIPFQFYAGTAKLPAGNYIVHMLPNSDLQIMEISSADGSTSALFEVDDAQANNAPAKNELIFNHYGKQYFLAEIFDEGNPDGSKVPASQYEKRATQAAAEAQQHVPAHHAGSQGN
jgi:hypothetical protein